MKIRQESVLAKLYASPKNVILANSPELKFVNALCNGYIDEAVGYFRERKLFGSNPPAVDAPYGRFEGLDEIRKFAQGWL